MLFKLLSGYSIIKDQFKKSRLIAIEIDSKDSQKQNAFFPIFKRESESLIVFKKLQW